MLIGSPMSVTMVTVVTMISKAGPEVGYALPFRERPILKGSGSAGEGAASTSMVKMRRWSIWFMNVPYATALLRKLRPDSQSPSSSKEPVKGLADL